MTQTRYKTIFFNHDVAALMSAAGASYLYSIPTLLLTVFFCFFVGVNNFALTTADAAWCKVIVIRGWGPKCRRSLGSRFFKMCVRLSTKRKTGRTEKIHQCHTFKPFKVICDDIEIWQLNHISLDHRWNVSTNILEPSYWAWFLRTTSCLSREVKGPAFRAQRNICWSTFCERL